MKLLTCVAVLSPEGGYKAMSYFDIQEAVLKKWNDQPSRNQWLVHGCYWELVVSSLVGDRDPSNPPSEAYVTSMLHNHLKRHGAPLVAPYSKGLSSMADAEVEAGVTLSGHVRDVFSVAFSQCREAYLHKVLEGTVKGMVAEFFEEWDEWEGYP